MVDNTRRMIITSEETDAIMKELMKNNRLILDIRDFRDFNYTYYNVAFKFPSDNLKVINSLLGEMLPNYYKDIKYDGEKFAELRRATNYTELLYDYLRVDGSDLCIRSKIKVLSTSDARREVELAFNNFCIYDEIIEPLKSFGKFKVTINPNIIDVVENDDSAYSKIAHNKNMCSILSSILLAKLYMEKHNMPLKVKYNDPTIKPNIIYLNQEEYLTLGGDVDEGTLIGVGYFPLDTLTIVANDYSDGAFAAKIFESMEVKCNTPEKAEFVLISKVTNSYAEYSEMLYAELKIDKLKDGELSMRIDPDRTSEALLGKIEDTEVLKGESIGYSALHRFMYIMLEMQKPKKIKAAKNAIQKKDKVDILKPRKGRKPKPPTQLDEQIIKLIKDKMVLIQNHTGERRNGSKHSYEYERRGCWCVSKTGKKFFRRSTTCCKGRGPKATHIYDYK